MLFNFDMNDVCVRLMEKYGSKHPNLESAIKELSKHSDAPQGFASAAAFYKAAGEKWEAATDEQRVELIANWSNGIDDDLAPRAASPSM